MNFIYPLFAMQEKGEKRGVRKINIDEAVKLNEEGNGIFWSVNMAQSAVQRLVSDINNVNINYHFIDLDGENKSLQWLKIIESPLIPSLCVETYSGFHVYWKTIYGNDLENFTEIQKRLIEYYDSDKACKDALRLLRCPSFLQWKHFGKNKKPFEVEVVFKTDLSYSLEDFLATFLPSEDERKVTICDDRSAFMKHRNENQLQWSLSWDKFLQLDQKELLERLSGTAYVNGEEYTFITNANGTEQICVNGKSTNCFMRGNDIVADRGYGNNIFNWLRWADYNNTDKDIIQILRHLVPEMFTEGVK